MFKMNNFRKAFLTCLSICLQVAVALPPIQTRILGGETTTIDKVPFLVQLHVNGRFHCGGTLTSERTVVTAAHCVKGINPDRFVVVAGASRTTDYGIRSKVTRTIMHRYYNDRTFDMDVAVMHLKTPITGPSVTPAGFCDKAIEAGAPVQLYGWGLLQEQNGYLPVQLQTVNVTVIPKSDCVHQYDHRMTLSDSMFCAGALGKDACSGDSGGPVTIYGRYCGIVSWGIGCGRPGSPGVYTDINKVKDFAAAAMQLI